MFEIKMAQEKDLAFIKDTYRLLDNKMMNLLNQLIEVVAEDDDQHPDEYWENLIHERTGYILIAFQEERPAGMAVVEKVDEREAHLEDLLVWPEFQKQGIGDSLIKKAKEYARTKGCSRMSLNVLANNVSAKSLYEKENFKDVKISMTCVL